MTASLFTHKFMAAGGKVQGYDGITVIFALTGTLKKFSFASVRIFVKSYIHKITKKNEKIHKWR